MYVSDPKSTGGNHKYAEASKSILHLFILFTIKKFKKAYILILLGKYKVLVIYF